MHADLERFLTSHELCRGAGRMDTSGQGECCSMQAVNWCLYGEWHDSIHPNESAVIGRWVIVLQDAMPDAMRNSEGWKASLLRLPGLGQKKADERARLDVILTWLWSVVLSDLQSTADRGGDEM